MKALVLMLAVAGAMWAAVADASANCKKGKPCGNSCIALDKVCRK